MYVAITRRPLWTKCPNNSGSLLQVAGLGNSFFLDQLDFSTTGYIAQIKVRPTKQRYCVATISINHYSYHSYVFLKIIRTYYEKFQYKNPFEAYIKKVVFVHVDAIKHYHTDNRMFKYSTLMQEVRGKRQIISICRVNYHFRNCKA